MADRLKDFLNRLNEETEGEPTNGEDEDRSPGNISSQDANVDPSTWRKIPNKVKTIYYYYTQKLPDKAKKEEDHDFPEFLGDVFEYLLSFSIIPNEVKAGEVIANFETDSGETSKKSKKKEEPEEEE